MRSNELGGWWVLARLGSAAALVLTGCGDDSVGGSGTEASSSSGTTGGTVGVTSIDPDDTGIVSMTGDGSTSSTGDSSSSGPGVDDTTTTGEDSTTGVPCFDVDMDGVEDCNGDCDDMDPSVYPGAPEICGDGVDNACGADPDPMATCQGLGTWVSELVGDDAMGDGTQANPVRTIGAGLVNAGIIGVGTDVYVAEGSYDEKVTMVEGTDILGGHQCDAVSCTWARDPVTYVSTILNTDFQGVLADGTITRATVLDGFSIVALDGNPGNGNTGAGITVLQGTPTIGNNLVYGPSVSGCSPCTSSGVILFGPSNDPLGTLVQGNVIEAGDNLLSGSNGIQLRTIANPAVAEIRGNEVHGGSARYTRGIDGFGSGPGTLVVDNDVYAGSQVGVAQGSSFGMLVSGQITVDGNRVNAVPAMVGACPSPQFWCGGIEAEGATAVITNNVVFGMQAPQSTAIFFGDNEVPFGELVINGNTLDGGSALGVVGGISTALACRTNQGVNAIVGRIRNNILGGGAAINRFGMYEADQSGGRTCVPEAYENNDIWFPASPASIDNAHRHWTAGGAQQLFPTVVEVNMQAYAAANFTADPQLDATWHLTAGSMCIDAGTPSEAPLYDFEGDLRPQGAGVDVGADETP